MTYVDAAIAPPRKTGQIKLYGAGAFEGMRKAGRLVAGFRGGAPADAEALADLVLRLARLGDDFPAVAELDLNPVLALPDRCVAVDARVRVAEPGTVVRAKSW